MLFASSAAVAQTNLITNPGFEDGNTGFTSDYFYNVNMYNVLNYVIGTSPRDYHSAWLDFGDHTTGSGNMMIVNAAQTEGEVVWGQTVAVASGTPYEFSYWIRLSYADNPPLLQVNSNGVEIGRFDASGASTGGWTKVTHEWLSDSSSAGITIIDLRPIYHGDDYVLDDLSLVALTIPVVINVHPTSDPNPLNLNSGGTTPVAILGSADFDVYEIDIASLTLAESTVKVVGKSDRALCSYDDIGSYDPDAFDKLGYPDGIDDLVCHFLTAEITPTPDGENTTVEVTGELYDGTQFVGSDFVKVVKE